MKWLNKLLDRLEEFLEPIFPEVAIDFDEIEKEQEKEEHKKPFDSMDASTKHLYKIEAMKDNN